jgi:enediyne biosynthesis protein E5
MKLLDPAGPVASPGLRPPGRSGLIPVTGPRRPTVSGAPSGHVAPATATRLDPRLYQIAVLTLLLGYGIAWLDLDIDPGRALAILGTALLTQLGGTTLGGLPRFDPRSALISGLSLCLLLRTNDAWLAALTAAVAVGSKFVLRVHGKHVFNPTNFALVLMMLATGQVWVSPGQWGSVAVFAFLLASAGGLVVNRAGRADVTWTFLACYVTLLVGRSVWLGDPLAIPLHRLENGALVLFAFFMISDPRTTPDSRVGRMLFAVMVAGGAYLVQFKLFRPNALLWSLALCSLIVPLIDRLLPGPRHQWRSMPEPLAGYERNMP